MLKFSESKIFTISNFDHQTLTLKMLSNSSDPILDLIKALAPLLRSKFTQSTFPFLHAIYKGV